MRLIEERQTVIGPGAKVCLSKSAASSVKDLMARWRVLGIEGDEVRVEDWEDAEDLRTFKFEDLIRISGGVEKIVSRAESSTGGNSSLYYPEHDRWPACIRQDESLFDDPLDGDEDEEDELEDE